jgi:hypothetical protein
MKRQRRLAGACVAAVSALMPLFSTASSVRAADFILDYADPGPCGDDRFLNSIVKDFRYQVTHVPNLPDVDILEFREIYEKRYLPEQKRWPIGRRYCGATVSLSDGDQRPIWYLIEEGMGLASIGDNVEFCVLGFDRWYVYNGDCRVLREPPPPLPSEL